MKDGGAAFPGMVTHHDVNETYDGVDYWNESYPGMTLRDWFAGQVFPSIYQAATDPLPHDWMDDMAAKAYMVADAMIAAREKRKDDW